MKFKKFIAILLTLCLLLPCSAVFAQSQPNNYDDGGKFTYVAFGDSFSRGMGCSANWEEECVIEYNIGPNQKRNITGAYPYIVAQALGCDCDTARGYLEEPDATFWPIVQNGLTISGVLDLMGIEDNYYDSLFYHNPITNHCIRYNQMLEYFGNPESAGKTEGTKFGEYGSVYNICELVEEADLVSLQLGMGDVYNRAIFSSELKFLGGKLDFSGADTATIAKFVANVIKLAYEGFEYFKKAYPLLIKKTVEMNADGEVVVLAVANPTFGVSISDDIDIQLGTVFSALSSSMNAYIKRWAEQYGATFVDISNVDTGAIVNDLTLLNGLLVGNNIEVGTHPSPEGHAYIAREIIRTYNQSEAAKRYDLILDIGRFDNISSVTVNGIPYKNYELKDNHLLTIHFKTPTATLLKITSVGTDGRTGSSTYQLAYRGGYTAYRISTTNNYVSATQKTTNAIRNITSKLFGR